MSRRRGYVIVNPHGVILDETFAPLRRWCIGEFARARLELWENYYREGFRCRRATQTIVVEGDGG